MGINVATVKRGTAAIAVYSPVARASLKPVLVDATAPFSIFFSQGFALETVLGARRGAPPSGVSAKRLYHRGVPYQLRWGVVRLQLIGSQGEVIDWEHVVAFCDAPVPVHKLGGKGALEFLIPTPRLLAGEVEFEVHPDFPGKVGP